MGNDKYITFDGRLRDGVVETHEKDGGWRQDEELKARARELVAQLKLETSASNVLIEIRRGPDWETADLGRVRVYDVFGAMFTSSMRGHISSVAKLLARGVITRVDIDWPDASVFDVMDGEVLGSSVFVEAPGSARGFNQ